jgi:hypothetical protein
MHRPKLVKRVTPPGDVPQIIRQTEVLLALLKDGGATPEIAAISLLRDLEHSAEDHDEIILCRILDGYTIRKNNDTLVSYNPRSAQTISEWPNCIALEPEGIHARRAYKKNIDTIKMMVEITEIDADEVRFICALFFVIRTRDGDYLCYG